MKQEYNIDQKEKMIYHFISGDCDIDDFENAANKLIGDENFDQQYNILNDLSRCRFKFRHENLDRFVQFFIEQFGSRTGKSAIVVESPVETAVASLFQKRVEETRKIHLFSTYKAAIDWLME